MPYVAGLDWASMEHALCVIDSAGREQGRFKIPHTASGLAELERILGGLGAPAELPVAIERPSGLVVEFLLEKGHPVVAIHPNVVKAARPRYGAALAKSDAGDAYLLADLLRTDGHRFPPLRPPSDATKALRLLVRARDDLVSTRVDLSNRLRALLESSWPGALAVFDDIVCPSALAFYARYPTPKKAETLTARRLDQFLRRHFCGGCPPASELLDRIRSAPIAPTGNLEGEASGGAVLALVAILQQTVAEVRRLEHAVEAALATHPDGPIVTSFPAAGKMNAAQILAELGDERARFPSDDQLAAEAGAAPVTRASGKHRAVVFRVACNKRLRQAVMTFAHNSRLRNAWAAAVYKKARGRGCRHSHAIRILARAWIRVLWRCWQNRRPYDPALHRAAAALPAATP